MQGGFSHVGKTSDLNQPLGVHVRMSLVANCWFSNVALEIGPWPGKAALPLMMYPGLQ